jgi:glutamate 5-kinase
VVETIDDRIVALAGGTTSATAVGGMASKIEAGRIATRSGCGLFIGSGSEAGLLKALLDGTAPGTFFVPSKLPMQSRKRWIAFFQPPQGVIHIDAGAERALRNEGRSLLAKGVVKAEGRFEAGDAVALAGPDGKPFARGLSRFSRETVEQLRGKTTEEIRRLQPGLNHTEIIHRDALVMH